MKRLRSTDDLDSYSEKSSSLKDSSANRSNSRSFYHKSDAARKGGLVSASSPSSRYDRDRSIDDDSRDSPRFVRKRTDYDFDSFDRRKGMGSSGFDRYAGSREGYSGGVGGNGGGGISADNRAVHRSESFSGSRREFPKGFRSERDRSRREGSVSSWRRFGSGSKDFEEGRASRSGNEDKVAVTRISPKGLKEVKSPTWSRDSSSEQSKMFRGSDKDEGKGKSWTSKSRSSPSWSKESGSEQQSKSVEVGKRNVDVEAKSVEVEATKSIEVETRSLKVETRSVEVETRSAEAEVKSDQSGGSSSEMEEGELEPEPDSKEEVEKENEKEIETGVKVDTEVKEQGNEVMKTDRPRKASLSELKVVDKAVELSNCEETLNKEPGIDADGIRDRGYRVIEEVKNSEELRSERKEGSGQAKAIENAKDVVNKSALENGLDLEASVQGSKNEVVEDNEEAPLNTNIVTQNLAQNMKDKGKSVIVSPARVADDAPWTETDSRGVLSSRDREEVDTEGPSTRGFELFGSSPVRKVEKEEQSGGGNKQKDERLVLEPLDLSLSLPNVLLPIGATKDTTQVHRGAQSDARSLQSFSSFRTNSDGFTASMSCSGSQSFFHNPSCSLTHNSLDLDNIEQSVHSRPLFQGIDWQAQAQAQNQNDLKHKDATSLYQKILMNGNGSLHQGMSNGQAAHGSSKASNGLERQMSLHKQLSGVQVRNHEEAARSSPSQSVGSQDMVPSYSFDKKRAAREKHSSSLYRSNSQKERFSIGGADFVETVISRIVSDPIHVMARKFHEMTAQSASCLKESIREIMLNADRQGQLCAFQTALHNRSDLTLDTILKSHRAQLEILVALKSGLVEYLKVDNSVSSSDLAEVFLNMKCRNLTCRSPLPVDDCDCKVCSKKTGFCSSCMCLVCSKFDMASNTCSWVGCDVCLHWCHADCALREAYIRNGRSPTDVQGTTEMQFRCVACDHPSEMFGFVKEVFQNFAKEWTAETLCKELEYVKRIFGGSKDARGRRLHEIADQMLAKMANKSNFRQVYGHIMGFLTDSDSSKFANVTAVYTGKEQAKGVVAGSVAGPSQDGNWRKLVSTEKGPKLERSSSLLPTFPPDLSDKRPVDTELLPRSSSSSLKEPVFDELEGIVRIKQAEAQMFQTRADDARRDAEGLKRIAIAKNEKIEEEYASRIAKLRLAETEELRKQKLQEFQALERAHREYFGMKMRMEADIKDLLLKMEATKRNLAI